MKNISDYLSDKENIQFGYGAVYDLCISIAFLILFILGQNALLDHYKCKLKQMTCLTLGMYQGIRMEGKIDRGKKDLKLWIFKLLSLL